jgi:Na+/citrate or Na+/malate symporter
MAADGESRKACLQSLVFSQLNNNNSESWTTSATRLSVIANMFALPSGTELILSDKQRMELVINKALFHLHSEVEVDEEMNHQFSSLKQMAAACLHNIALAMSQQGTFSNELLIGSLRGLSQEEDGLVIERRVLSAGIILRKFPQTKDTVMTSE